MDSFIKWIGGKRQLKKKIIEQFPDEFERYVEVFGGAGWVLFDKDKHANIEVYNDVNSNLVNLYRCVKYHPEALQKELEWTLISREQFFDCKDQNNVKGMTDIQRAARFYTLIKESFGADTKSFGLRSINMLKAVDYLQDVSKRLSRVVIENVDFEQLIKVYDRKETLFYLDPPYYDAEKYYPDRFNIEDHQRLKDILSQIKGKFILSYNDCESIRELYQEYNLIKISRFDNFLSKQGGGSYQELIIKNY